MRIPRKHPIVFPFVRLTETSVVLIALGAIVVGLSILIRQAPRAKATRGEGSFLAQHSAGPASAGNESLSAVDYNSLTNWLLAPFLPRNEGMIPGDAQEGIRGLGTNILPTLLTLLREPNTNLPQSVGMTVVGFETLGAAAGPAVGSLIECLDDEQADVRAAAASALGKIGKPAARAVPRLIKALWDKEQSVRLDALIALVMIPGEPDVVVPPVVEFLQGPHAGDDKGEWEQVAAIAVLSQHYVEHCAQAIPVLRRMTNNPSTIIRVRASALLSAVEHPEPPHEVPSAYPFNFRRTGS